MPLFNNALIAQWQAAPHSAIARGSGVLYYILGQNIIIPWKNRAASRTGLGAKGIIYTNFGNMPLIPWPHRISSGAPPPVIRNEFFCHGATNVIFNIVAPKTGLFNCDGKTNVSFFGTQKYGFRCDGHTSVIFTSRGAVLGRFSSSGHTDVSFISSLVPVPHFHVDGHTDVIFYVRAGQTPSCMYDNGFIDPDNKILNYVF